MKEAGPGSSHGFGFHLQTLIIRKLNFYQNYNASTLILLTKIVQCSIFPWTKCINSTCFDMGFRASLARAWLKHIPTKGPMWGYPRGRFWDLGTVLEPFWGEQSSKEDKPVRNWLSKYSHEGTCVAHSTPTQTRDLISNKISESRFAEVNCHTYSST